MARSAAVDFTLRANISDLKSELGRIPGITDKEAKKMAGAMEKGLLRAERAAKKTAQVMRGDLGQSVGDLIEKFRGVSAAAGVTGEKFDAMKAHASETAGRVEKLGDSIGQADSSLSAIAGAIHQVNPELAEMTRQGADALGAMEGLILAAKGGPVVFGVAAAAIGGLYLAFGEAAEQAKKLEEANQKTMELEEKRQGVIARHVAITEKTATTYGLFTGELNQFDQVLEANNKEIDQASRQMIRLNRNHPRFGEISRNAEAWARAQKALNQEIRDFQVAQQRANVEAKIANDNYIQFSISQRVAAESSSGARGAYERETAQLAFLDASVQGHLVTMEIATQARRQEAAAAGVSTDKLSKSNLAYAEGLVAVRKYADNVEDLSGRTFRVLDFQGDQVQTLGRLMSAYNGVREATELAMLVQDVETGQILSQTDLINLEIQARSARDKERKQRSEAHRARLDAENKAEIKALETRLSSLTDQAAANADQVALEVMTSEARLDVLESRAIAELDLLRSDLEAKELLTTAAATELGQAELDIASYFAAQRKAEATDSTEEIVSAYEQLQTSLEDLDITGLITSPEALDALSELRSTAAMLRSEFVASGEAITPAIEAQLEAMVRLAELADGIPEWLRDYGAALGEAQIKFDTVWGEIGSQVETQADHLGTFFEGVEDGMTVLGERLAEKDRKRALQIFKIQQGAAISQAVISGALAIAKVTEQLGIFAPLAIAGVVASTAAQVAVIAAEQPSFDTGGVIGSGGGMARTPDQVMIRALPGEAVLNRETTSRLGADGVDRLNRGGAPEVVVRPVSSFKHFDRFTRAEFRRSGYFKSLFDQDREFAPGQRSY